MGPVAQYRLTVRDHFLKCYSAVKGKTPQAGDRVLVEATYNPNMPFKWNAQRIQTLPNQVHETASSASCWQLFA